MIDRTQRILLELMKQRESLTSEQLAQKVGVSSRTIKSEMPRVASTLEQNGAHLEARRNCGYAIEVEDAARYDDLREEIQIRAVHIAMAGYDDTSRLLHICRKLVAAPTGAKVDEIAEDLCLSRSAVQKPLRQARAICESYHLTVASSPGGGTRVYGTEHMMRIAMVEFFEIHFHKFKLDESDQEYARWIGCDYQERQDIRHCFLKTLRESGVSMRDSATQRMAMYFIIARNRVRAGLNVILPEAWIDEIRTTPYFKVSQAIIDDLNASFEGFAFNRHEVAFLAIWMLQNHDVNCSVPLEPLAPYLYREVQDTAAAMIEVVERRTGCPFSQLSGLQPLLEQTILPMLAGHRYGMDGGRRFDYESERKCLRSPVAVYVGSEFVVALSEIVGCSYSLSDTMMLAAMVLGIVDRVSFPVKPLRMLITSGLGPEYARIEGEMLQQRFGPLIASVHACELYEIRGYDEADYDVAITDVGTFGYNYSYPVAAMGIVRPDEDMRGVHDDILINAYDIDGLLPSDEAVQVHSCIHLETVEQFLALLRLEYEGVDEVARVLDRAATAKDMPLESTPVPIRHGRMFVVAPLMTELDDGDGLQASHQRSERFEFYQFATPLRWGGERVSSAFLCIFDFSRGMERFKALERLLYLLATKVSDLTPFMEHPAPFIRELLRDSLKIMPTIG